jgi:UDP-N-acetylglucosamine diphosphorylase / glucose-1-phosphate thymidylyltransferase / UDP-N-acetylgalactosamine diphosphorylase / glucosamine-1-phosphate N-acetyltransferase / galactosamine-1-phosphate N-acetyltransferase
MSAVYLYDDAAARRFEPFASTRPISELVAGIALIRERWRLAMQPSDGLFFIAGERHADFDEPGAVAANGVIPAGSIVVNSRCVPQLPADTQSVARRVAPCTMWRCGNRMAALRLREPMDALEFADGTLTLDEIAAGTGAIAEVHGWWLDEVWDLIRFMNEQLAHDIPVATRGLSGSLPRHATILGDQPLFIAQDAVIEPHVVLDATAGPIMIAEGSHVRAFSRISGPCYIGRHVTVVGGDVTGCSIGDWSKVRGELSTSVVVGHSNKGHDGFIGHSYLGRWVNIGAGTITSNLKNTYGPVTMWTPGGVRNTNMQFLGTMFGDHVKTGIGLRLTTGTVLGAGSNVYGAMPPKVVAPFSWGDAWPYQLHQADKFIEGATRMMARRSVTLSERGRRHLAATHASRWVLEERES